MTRRIRQRMIMILVTAALCSSVMAKPLFPDCRGKVCDMTPAAGGRFISASWCGPRLVLGVFLLNLPAHPQTIRHDQHAVTVKWRDGRRLVVIRRGNAFFQYLNTRAGITAHDAGQRMYLLTSRKQTSRNKPMWQLDRLLLFMKQVHLSGAKRLTRWQIGDKILIYSARTADMEKSDIKILHVMDVFHRREAGEFLHVVGMRFSYKGFLRLFGNRQLVQRQYRNGNHRQSKKGCSQNP